MDTIGALGGMLNIPQWFVWRLTWDQEENKFQKMPCYPDGSKYRMNAQDAQNWQTFTTARATLDRLRAANDGHAYTLGFWLTADTGYWFLDIDKCVTNGELLPVAQMFMQGFAGAAWEWSSSGQGLHIFGRGVVPEHRRRDVHGANLEFYNDKRGIAFGLSGQFAGNADTTHDAAIAWTVANYFPAAALPGEVLDSEFDKPVATWHGPADDDELIALIRSRERMDAGAVFAGLPAERATFTDLFDGRQDVLNRLYAGDSDKDFALIGILSFWTGRDALRTERIMRRSALQRDKWDTNRGKENYLRYSILRQFRAAHAEGRDVYGSQRTGSTEHGVLATGGTSATGQTDPGSTNGTPSTPLVTVTTNTEKRDAVRAAQAAFAAAGDPFELEAVARSLGADTRLDDGAREGLAHDLMERFEQLQTKRKITHCRAMVAAPDSAGPAPGSHRECTELGNAYRMQDAYGQNLMYVCETEKWFKWDDLHWREAKREEMMFLATSVVEQIAEEARNEENEVTRQGLLAWSRESQKNAMFRNMIEQLKSRPAVFALASSVDADTRYMGTPNGAIDLTTGALLAPDRNRRITFQTRVPYNLNADCPLFKKAIRDAFFDDIEMVMFFKRLMGYCVLGNPTESILLMAYGHGANGKSTIFNAITHAMGDYADVARASTFTSSESSRSGDAGAPREDLVRLRNFRLLTISELDENAHLREASVKSMTGGDSITARNVNASASITFKPKFVPIIMTNHKPIIKGDDNGIWRRIVPLPFDRNFKADPNVQEDPFLAQKLEGEAEGILRWLVEGALEYQQVGLRYPLRINIERQEYRDDMDILSEWITTKLEFDPTYACSVGDIFQSWQSYAIPKGLFKFVSTQNALTRKLSGRPGFTKAQHKQGIKGRCWIGVRVRNVAMAGT